MKRDFETKMRIFYYGFVTLFFENEFIFWTLQHCLCERQRLLLKDRLQGKVTRNITRLTKIIKRMNSTLNSRLQDP